MRALTLALIFAISISNEIGLDQDFRTVQMKVTKVSKHVYILASVGKVIAGNITAFIGNDGIVLVDDQYAQLVDQIRAVLNEITKSRVRYVINTHYHFDHTSANEIFQEDATVIAHDNVRKRLESGSMIGNFGSLEIYQSPAAYPRLPILTFDHEVTIHLNGEDIVALHYPNGHTDGDTVVFFSKDKVVSMGDDFVTYGFPTIDLTNGGSVTGLIAALEDVIRRVPDDVKVVPGHGPVSTLDDLRRYVFMLRQTRAAVDTGIRQGRTSDQLKEEKVLGPWSSWSKGSVVNTNMFIDTLYNDDLIARAREGSPH